MPQDDLSQYEVKEGDDLSKYEVKPEEPSFGEKLNQASQLVPWPKFDTSHPVTSTGNELLTGLENLGGGLISSVEGIPSMLEHPIQSVEGIPRGMYEMGKTALTGHPEYALGQMIPGMAAGEAASAVGIPKISNLGGMRGKLATSLTKESGALKSLPSALSRAAGAGVGHLTGVPGGEIVGALTGPALLKGIIGDRPLVPEPEIGTPENPGFHSRLPTRMPKIAPPTAPTPFGGVEAPTPQAGIPKIAGGTPAATVSGPQSLRFMGPGETPTPPEAPRIVQPDSAPPDVKVTYQSVPGEELARKAQKGDLDAVRELRRRGGQDLPANTKYLIEPGAVNKPWRNLER